MFQSSLNLSVGCSPKCFPPGRVPSPVSILTQPFGWVQLGRVRNRFLVVGFNPHPISRLGADGCGPPVVSILTKPRGWVQRAVRHPSFQSSPNLSVGCNFRLMDPGVPVTEFQSPPKPLGWVQCYTGGRIAGTWPSFNPHSTSWLGAGGCGPLAVSILTQPIGWVQPVRTCRSPSF